MKGYNYILLFIFIVFLPLCGKAQINASGIHFEATDIATGLDTPWEILWGPDNHIWITERYGRVSRINPETGEMKPLITIDDVHEESESGLLGMALHPNFESEPFVYLIYNYLDKGIHERLVRYTYDGEHLANPLVLLENIPGAGNHNGSRIVIGPDLKLYFTLGDATDISTSQDMESFNGKTLRMNLNGTIPDDNPFIDSYIWSLGHRNPQGLVFSPEGKLYSSEHGPQNDDEVNLLIAGANYGWPVVHGFCDEGTEQDFCEDVGVAEPLAAWTPTLAVAGIDYYSHSFISFWERALLLSSLKAGKLLSLHLSDDGTQIVDEKTWVNNEFGRLRDICISPGGRVFISTSNRDGRGDPSAIDDRIIELIPDALNSVRNQPANSGIKVFPNPAQDEITVSVNSDWEYSRINIINVYGQLVGSHQLSSDQLLISLENYKPGIYLFWVFKENRNFQSTVVVVP